MNDTTDGIIVTDYSLHGKNIVHMTRKNDSLTINDSLHFFYPEGLSLNAWIHSFEAYPNVELVYRNEGRIYPDAAGFYH